MKRLALSASLLLLSVFSGPATPAADGPTTFTVSDLTFDRPAAWGWVPVNSPMRKAQLSVPNAAGEAGEVVFFNFGPGNGGGTQANVERWYRMFKEDRAQIRARTEEGKAGTLKTTFAFAEGTYLSGMPGGPQTPKPGFALAGAILENPQGYIFVRLTGPKALVEAATSDFKKMVLSARR